MNESVRPSSGASAMRNSNDLLLDEIEKLDDKTRERLANLAMLLNNNQEESNQKHEALLQLLQENQSRQNAMESQLSKMQELLNQQQMLTGLKDLLNYQAELTSKACRSTQEMSSTSRKQMDDLFAQLMPMLALPKQLKELQQILSDDLALHSKGSTQYQALTAQAKELMLNLQQSIEKVEKFPSDIRTNFQTIQKGMKEHLDASMEKITTQTDNAVTSMKASYRHQPIAMSKEIMLCSVAALAVTFLITGALLAYRYWSTEITQYDQALRSYQAVWQELQQIKAKSPRK